MTAARTAALRILSVEPDGSLVISPSNRHKTALQKLGGRLDAQKGGWIIPPDRADEAQKLVAPDTIKALPSHPGLKVTQDGSGYRVEVKDPALLETIASLPGATKQGRARAFRIRPTGRNALLEILGSAPAPKPNLAAAAVEAAAGIEATEGVKLRRVGASTVRVRLTRVAKEAVAELKTARLRWIPTEGEWEGKVLSPADAARIQTALHQASAAIAKQREEQAQSRQITKVVPIADAPDLGTPVMHDGQLVVFERAGRLFRLHEGHLRQNPSLKDYVGTWGCVLYGKPFDEEGVLADERQNLASCRSLRYP